MTEPLRRPSATGVRIAGDRFQWLFAWGACVEALLDDAPGVANPTVSIGVELDGVGNLDDVVVRRTRPPHIYKQVKYAVDSSTPVNMAYLTEPSSSGGPSILTKIASTWRGLSQDGDGVELAIVTNRQADPNDLLVSHRDSRTQLLMPRAGEGGARSSVGKSRAQWATAAGVTEPELLELLGVLRFQLGRDPADEARLVKLQMAAAGLRQDDSALNSGIDWVARQVIDGRRQIEIADIRVFIETEGLRAEATRAVVSVATLMPDPLADHALVAIDWVDRFDGDDAYSKRRPRSPASWAELQGEIEAIPSRLGSTRRLLVTGSLRLAPAFAVGAALRQVSGFEIAAVQRGEIWSSDETYSAVAAPTVVEHQVDQGVDLAVVIEVATPIANDVMAWIREQHVPVGRLIAISPAGGPRDNAVAGPDDACALAIGIREVVRREVKGCPRVHLFIAGPMGLALLLGHRWNRVAPTVVYEDLAALGYDAAFTVSA